MNSKDNNKTPIALVAFNTVTMLCFAVSFGFSVFFGFFHPMRTYVIISVTASVILAFMAVLAGAVSYVYSRKETENKKLLEDMEKMTLTMEELKKQKASAEHDNEAKTAFLNSLASQLRTPLNTILGMDELLAQKNPDEDEMEALDNIYSAGRIMESLVKDLSDLSKIEKGTLYIEQAAYSISEVISKTYLLIHDSADAKSIDMSLSVDETLPSVLRGDGQRMKQVVLNLLANAVGYTPIGKVHVEVTYEKAEEENAIVLNVKVSDTGIGIKKADLESFHLLGTKADPVDMVLDGVGLSLTVTNQILQQMGSSLQVESEYGQGSTFCFSLVQEVLDQRPVGTVDEILHSTTDRKKEAVNTFVAPKARVLAVDDNRMNLAVINGMLKNTKIQLDCVNSGKECLEAVAKEHYDVILLDYMMPGMDGIATIRKMKELEDNKCKDTPIIAVTASAATGAKDYYLRFGFTDYISKPVGLATLYQILRQYLPEEYVMKPDSVDEIIAADVIDIQEKIEKEYSKEDVFEAVKAIKRAMTNFDIDGAKEILFKMKDGTIPQDYVEIINKTATYMEKEKYEKVAGCLEQIVPEGE
ncbi:MAG: response regulator [Lachnospiraceae bacterium]|nr:response regulator [Lachnospiraceae bacterium]